MTSFISSFRPLIAAAIAVVGMEAAIATALHPTPVERANYLNWTFDQPEPFHKLVIYEKMNRLALSKPDIVQVGDSGGFHGVRPDIVMRYLGGLRYVNLSCCANTGYDGYYDIAKFAFDRTPHPKAIVLYMSFNNIPHKDSLQTNGILGTAKIHDAFSGPWSALDVPSETLRPKITEVIYTLDGLIMPRRTGFTNSALTQEATRSVDENFGWWAEHDPRMAATMTSGLTVHLQYRFTLCGTCSGGPDFCQPRSSKNLPTWPRATEPSSSSSFIRTLAANLTAG
jgi:hypothetical protein